ncbi:MAG: hypothetical protein SZ59_C0001G0048 [candidate division TM6 bacterium GW2011_GWF2_28_16]|jgi:hypothetical protein|nr:MAG: hypothetical protein SZ59_C0001G0048 [candidate division TM6 bacterium GW2011_GWF2_28_16]
MQYPEKFNLKQKFKSSFKWNIAGGLFYEASKITNQILLIKIMTTQDYGLMASIFAIIYLAIYLTEFGSSQTIPVFLNIFTKNQSSFKNIFLKFYILPQILFFIIAAVITFFWYKNSLFLSSNSPYIFLIPGIIIFEGLRIFLRRFLHNIFISKSTIIIESILMALFLSAIWIPYFIFNKQITLNLIFIPFFINSVLAIIFFIYLLKKYYANLPNNHNSENNKIIYKIIKTRTLNYAINISKNLFTGNFLTPYLAANIGWSEAGIFNLASHIAESIKAITKSTVIFSGGGLFAKLKSKSIFVKKSAFALVCKNLNKIIYPVIIFTLINSKFIFDIKKTTISQETFSIVILFFLISSFEYFFSIYEQFFIIEENAGKLLFIKLFEFLMFFIAIKITNYNNAISILLSLIIVKLISFFLLSTSAFYIWKLKPNFKISKNLLFISILISILFYLLYQFH